MKIRISDQSLRIRLSEQEASALEHGAFITSSLRLNAIDTFEIELHTWHLNIGEIQSEKNKLVVSIPQEAASQLAHDNGFLYRCKQESHTLPSLTIEVEIDLQKAKHS